MAIKHIINEYEFLLATPNSAESKGGGILYVLDYGIYPDWKSPHHSGLIPFYRFINTNDMNKTINDYMHYTGIDKITRHVFYHPCASLEKREQILNDPDVNFQDFWCNEHFVPNNFEEGYTVPRFLLIESKNQPTPIITLVSDPDRFIEHLKSESFDKCNLGSVWVNNGTFYSYNLTKSEIVNVKKIPFFYQKVLERNYKHNLHGIN